MQKQSRFISAVEASANIMTGMLVSYAAFHYVVPIFWPHLQSSSGTSFAVVALFTVFSFTRQYFWRRFFANELHKILILKIKGVPNE